MMNLINKGIEYFNGFNTEQWLWMLLALLFLLYILYNRKQYTQVFDNAVVMAETSFNYGANKEKLEAAIKYVQSRISTLPFFARVIIQFFLNQKRIEQLIEKSLQKFSNIFGTGRKVRINSNNK